MACAYCYVPRRKGYANPITVFTNIDKIAPLSARHVKRQGPKPEPDQIDPAAWVYDIGENSDCSVDALVSDNIADLVATFRDLPTAKASFATKFVNRELLDLDPRGRTRVRFSLMPERDARLLDIRTARSPSGSPRSTTSSRPATRCTSTSPRVVCAGWEAAGPSCSTSSTTSWPGRRRRRPPPR